ncbi:MAG: glycoside hydrolase family 3 C-terminal domain-containing protein [Deltaproteobacteria bacterium]|nr:glycoside hydrolase family 3 C-terminal domain-containing protein [Deltaproteobacteria bacterium]
MRKALNRLTFIVLALSFLSCLSPRSVETANRAGSFVGRCKSAESTMVPMHSRSDIDWPSATCRARAAEIIGQMSLEEKISQMVQPDQHQLRDLNDLARYAIGSVLSGGNTDPPSNNAMGWTKMVARVRAVSLKNRLNIPILYGVDAVHGHNNVKGAVIFPHNIGLGCTRDAELVRRIGRITAEEVAATGINWSFAPVLAASRDERWGRAYEAFGETPELAAELGAALIQGLQGERLGSAYPSILACAKHFAGDGGTLSGIDQGNTAIDYETFLRLHANQYQAAIDARVGSIMVSFSSVNGVMMHCNGSLLTDLLKGQMKFNGFLVSDWEAVEKTPGDYETQVENAINAGLDIVMAPKSYKMYISTLKALVPGRVPLSRIEDAVGRILSIKCELGLLESERYSRYINDLVGRQTDLLHALGSEAHREVARRAVRQSLVLLKNENGLLPLSKNLPRVHLAGKNADNLGYQCGGWTIGWQGLSGSITRGTTIAQAVRKAVGTTTEVSYSIDGTGAEGAAAAIVVIGEKPYAEGAGDRSDLSLEAQDIAAVKAVKNAGVPVVVVLIGGRPLILGAVLDEADALIAAWLPGSEGQGVSDVIFGDHAPTGKLSVSWPRCMEQIPINWGDHDYDPLFPYGFGLTY